MDERGVRVLGVDFDTYLSQWGGSCPKESFKTSLKERGADIYQKLRDAGVGDRKVVFVGHSMGGLIIKQVSVAYLQYQLRSGPLRGGGWIGVNYRNNKSQCACNKRSIRFASVVLKGVSCPARLT